MSQGKSLFFSWLYYWLACADTGIPSSRHKMQAWDTCGADEIYTCAGLSQMMVA